MSREVFEKLNENFKVRIENLRGKIQDFMALGNDVYEIPKKSLPFYEYAHSIEKNIKQFQGLDVSIDELFAECGLPYDKDFGQFQKFFKAVKKYEKDGFVSFPAGGEKNVTYTQLKDYAIKYDCNPFDFLFLMTGLKLKDSYIQGDYVQDLVSKLHAAYPTGDLSGIKRDHPELYEGIRHLKKYLPEDISSKDLIESLGFYGGKFSKEKSKTKVSKKDVLEKLIKIYPDRKVENIYKLNNHLYHEIVKVALQEDKTPTQFLTENGFTYPHGKDNARLSKIKTDVPKRTAFLQEKLDAKLEKENLNGLTEIERFRLQVKVMEEILNENDLKVGKTAAKSYKRNVTNEN